MRAANGQRGPAERTGGETLDVSQLKRIPLFSDASDEELGRVAVFAESKEIPEGEVVIEEGATRGSSSRSRTARRR